MKRLFVTLLVLFSYSVAEAQDCTEMLKYGIYDIRALDVNEQTAATFKQWFCGEQFSQQSSVNSFGANAAFPLKGVPVELGLDSEGKNWSEWRSGFCGGKETTNNFSFKLNEQIKTVSQALLKEFNKCMESDGLHVWLELTGDPHRFVFAARYNSPAPEVPKLSRASITSFQPGKNVRCDETPTSIGQKSEWRTACTRNNDKAVAMVVNTRLVSIHGGGKLQLSPIPSMPASVAVPHPPPLFQCATADEVVRAIYLQMLDREAEETGVRSHTPLLTTHKNTVRDLVKFFAAGEEYKKRFTFAGNHAETAKGLYRHILAREGEPDGVNHQASHIPILGYNQIVINFVESKEYDLKFGNWGVPTQEGKTQLRYCN